jgi:hypothetical protein
MFSLRNLSRGTVVGGLTLIAMVATTFGKPQLAAFLGDPSTADMLQAVIVSGGALIAGVMEGVKAKAAKA